MGITAVVFQMRKSTNNYLGEKAERVLMVLFLFVCLFVFQPFIDLLICSCIPLLSHSLVI